MNAMSQFGWTPGFQLPPRGLSGIGDTTQQGDAKTAAGSLSQLVPLATVAGGPIAGAAVGAAAALANIVSLFGPNPNNTVTTGWVNQIEADVMKPNLAGWLALSSDEKTPSNQAAFLQNFYNGWNQVVQLCSNAALGSAGTNCIADRQNGACHWTTTGQTPGQPPNCGNWYVWYHDPIANDPEVAANAAASYSPTVTNPVTGAQLPVTSTAPAAAGGSTTQNTPTTTTPPASNMYYLYAGLALLTLGALFLIGGDD
jgi:hypothetical protein